MDLKLWTLLCIMAGLAHCSQPGVQQYGNPYNPSVYKPASSQYCPLTPTEVLIDQPMYLQAYNTYENCRATVKLNTCSGSKCPNYYYCHCCKPSAHKSWVSQEVQFVCQRSYIRKTQWYVLQPSYCLCTTC